MILSEAFDTLRRIRGEFDAARFALSYALDSWNTDPEMVRKALRTPVSNAELRRCALNLEVTFVLRLFSDFEVVLRDYWRAGLGRTTEPDMRPLMESIAVRRKMRGEDLVIAHQIREYRNQVIHERLRTPRFDFPHCMRALGLYLRWLPQKW